jgi:hypothetical protein
LKRRALPSVILLALCLAVSFQPAQTATEGWLMITPGIDYQQFLAAGPNDVFVARMDRSNPDLTIESMSAFGKLSGGREKISRMAERSNGAINYWGEVWGNRNRVIVAINGDFELPDLAVPARGQVTSGWYSRRFADKQNGSGFVWTLDRQAFIGECISHPVARQAITLPDGTPIEFQGINRDRGEEELILYTPQYDATTRTTGGGVEVLVEMITPSLIMPKPTYSAGIARQVINGGSTPIPFDHVVLSGSGKYANQLRNYVTTGAEIRISQELRHFSEWDCVSPLSSPSWTRAYASIGGSFYFLKNGKIQRENESGANIRNPRTAVAFNDQFIFFIVVDGRNTSGDSNPGVSLGMTMAELGRFARDTLGATYAVNQDGGGSSEMVVNGVIVNTPSDGLKYTADLAQAEVAERVYLPLVGKATAAVNTPPQTAGPKVERSVVNGLMMVLVEPKEQSALFAAGETVRVTTETGLRLGPGTNYAALTTVSPGAAGAILPHNLAGVLAKGSYWWKVDFGGLAGWVPQETLGR